MKNNKKIPTLIGVFVLILGLAGGVILVNRETIFKLGASPETTPKDVRVSNITDGSFAVSWITDKPTSGFVKWGETSNLGSTATAEVPTKQSIAHTVVVKNLSKSKTYYFSINSAGQDSFNNGIPWNTTTKASIPSEVTRISGTVSLQTGAPADDAIVYIDANGMTEQSTMTSASGNWVIAIPQATKDTLLNIYVQAGSVGIATAQVYVSSANPVPAMILGKTYDFRTATQTVPGTVPDSAVTLPTTTTASAEGQSRFNLETSATPQPANTMVTVKSVDEGETIYSTKPEFFGEGPKDTQMTITVHSQTAITQNVKVGADGTWQWSTPQNLEDGSHTLTISWKDAKGILRTITKSFVVVANAQEPAFVSTPSASLTPSPTVVATATPTIAPTVAPTLTPTLKPTVKPTQTATAPALPVAGSPYATVGFIAVGVSFLLGGLYVNMALKGSD